MKQSIEWLSPLLFKRQLWEFMGLDRVQVVDQL